MLNRSWSGTAYSMHTATKKLQPNVKPTKNTFQLKRLKSEYFFSQRTLTVVNWCVCVCVMWFLCFTFSGLFFSPSLLTLNSSERLYAGKNRRARIWLDLIDKCADIIFLRCFIVKNTICEVQKKNTKKYIYPLAMQQDVFHLIRNVKI